MIQQALGGHAIPIDRHTHRALVRLGITESTIPDLRAVLERAVPKNRGAEFLDLLEDLANDTCVDGEPDCPRCELRKICPFVQVRKHESTLSDSAGSVRPAKPRPGKEKDATRTPKAKPVDVAPPPAPAPAPPPGAIKKSPSAHAAKENPSPPKPARGKRSH